MKEFKGSPAPWTLTEKKQTHIDSEEGSWFGLAKVYTKISSTLKEREDENSLIGKYNALLISKSPELLEQLKTLLDTLDDMFEEYKGELPSDLEESIVPLMAKTEDLIKSATTLKEK